MKNGKYKIKDTSRFSTHQGPSLCFQDGTKIAATLPCFSGGATPSPHTGGEMAAKNDHI